MKDFVPRQSAGLALFGKSSITPPDSKVGYICSCYFFENRSLPLLDQWKEHGRIIFIGLMNHWLKPSPPAISALHYTIDLEGLFNWESSPFLDDRKMLMCWRWGPVLNSVEWHILQQTAMQIWFCSGGVKNVNVVHPEKKHRVLNLCILKCRTRGSTFGSIKQHSTSAGFLSRFLTLCPSGF